LKHAHRKFVTHAVLAAALLIAQLAAQAHALSHSRWAGDADSIPTQSQLCQDCLAGTPLLAAASAPDAGLLLPPIQTQVADTASRASLVEHRTHHAFRSRAPPLSL
jgi:hypothetical protein